MKNAMLWLVIIGLCLCVGCATSFPAGNIYTNLKLPVASTANANSPKVGTATCNSYFSMVAVGDASIQTAAKSVGITKIHHVDWEVKNILGIIGTYKVVVYGE